MDTRLEQYPHEIPRLVLVSILSVSWSIYLPHYQDMSTIRTICVCILVYTVYTYILYILTVNVSTQTDDFFHLYQCPKFNGFEPTFKPINVGYNAMLSPLLSKYVRRNCLQLRMIIHTSERRPVFGRTLGLSQKFGTSKDFEPSTVSVYVSCPE